MSPLYDALAGQLIGYLPAVARLAAMAGAAPVFSAGTVPPAVRAALVMAVGVATCGLVPLAAPPPDLGTEGYLLILLGEVLFGLALGLGARLLLEAFSFAGQVLDLQIGLQAGALFDPTSQQQTTPLGHLYGLFGTVLFLELGGHHWLLSGVFDSFRQVPPGQLVLGKGVLELATGLGTSIFQLAVQITAPITLTLFLADIVFGIIARMVPQMNAFLVEMPAKIGLGLLAMAACAPLLFQVGTALLEDLRTYLQAMVRIAGG